MTQYEKTSAMLNDLDFTNHDSNNLLECFYAAASEAQILAKKIDVIVLECNYATSTMARCSLPHAIKQIVEAEP